MLVPNSITFENYMFVLSSKAILGGFKVTFIVLVLGTTYNMLLTISTAYALSKDHFPGKKIIVYLIIFTMFFNGGLIPYYLLIKSLGLINKIGAMILPFGINTFYMLIMRNYFHNIPDEIEESAKMDGANEILILIKLIVPLSMPVIATFILFYGVDRWNEWWNGMLFIRDVNKIPLQLVLRSILSNVGRLDEGSRGIAMKTKVFQDGVKMASIVVVMVPIMFLYPYLQKYFLKGLLAGSLKA